MCSVGDDFEGEGLKHMPITTKSNKDVVKCNKCRAEAPIVLLRGKDAYCKQCFIAGAKHKFKALLGKSKLLRPNDRVLVSYEVGHPSTALLHLLREGLELNTPKKLRFEPVVVFIEGQYHLSAPEREAMTRSVIKDVEFFKFKVHLVSLADSLVNDKVTLLDHSSLSVKDSDQENINNFLKKGASKTTKMEILRLLKRNLLVSLAKELKCKYVFTPELSVDIASNLLTNISLGRGAQVPNDTGFCDNRDKNVTILRPLRSFDTKELAFYNVVHHLDPVFVRQPPVNPYASVQDLMRRFVNDLQENYPATVATVVKTGDKLSVNTGLGECKLCKGVLLRQSQELDACESINFSKVASNELPNHALSRQERYAAVVAKFDNASHTSSNFCYSCAKISHFLLDN